jgi:hypothetical protein
MEGNSPERTESRTAGNGAMNEVKDFLLCESLEGSFLYILTGLYQNSKFRHR